MSQEQLELDFGDNIPADLKPESDKAYRPMTVEQRRKWFGHRITIASDIEPGKSNEDIEHLKRYDDLQRPLLLRRMSFDRLVLFERRMTAEFPWMANVIQHVRKQCYLRLVLDRPEFYLRPFLLVGPPGIGKTRFLRRLGEELHVPLAILNVAGSADNRELEGTSRGWSSGDASFPVKFINRKKCPNPIIVLDELDKESDGNRNGRMTDTLHQLLEQENARHWRDAYLCTEVDLSHVTWLAAANRVDQLNPSLLSRFTVTKVRAPVGSELFAVVHGAMRDFSRRLDLEPAWLPSINELEWLVLEDMILNSAPSPRVIVRWVQGLLERKLEWPEMH